MTSQFHLAVALAVHLLHLPGPAIDQLKKLSHSRVVLNLLLLSTCLLASRGWVLSLLVIEDDIFSGFDCYQVARYLDVVYACYELYLRLFTCIACTYLV